MASSSSAGNPAENGSTMLSACVIRTGLTFVPATAQAGRSIKADISGNTMCARKKNTGKTAPAEQRGAVSPRMYERDRKTAGQTAVKLPDLLFLSGIHRWHGCNSAAPGKKTRHFLYPTIPILRRRAILSENRSSTPGSTIVLFPGRSSVYSS